MVLKLENEPGIKVIMLKLILKLLIV